MLQRFAQLQVELSARLGLLVHRRLEHATAVPAIGLGTVEGHIGVLQQYARIFPVLREQSDADTGPGMYFVPVDRERCGESGQNLVGQRRGVRDLAQLWLDQRKFVPANPRQRVRCANLQDMRSATSHRRRSPAA